ncbi:MAG: hypothetical protein ACSHX8_00865 [Opitutaceae bacterium]
MTILYVILGLYLLYRISPYVLAYFEGEQVRGDLEAKPYESSDWASSYLEEHNDAAKALGLIFCGSYFTVPGASIVKGPMLLYQTECGRALVCLVSARIWGMELKKIEVKTKFLNGRVLFTSDQAILPDITGGSTKKIVYGGSLEELLTTHMDVLGEDERIELIQPQNAFEYYESIEFERAARLVSSGFSYWSDKSNTKIKRTVKGAIETVKFNRASGKSILSEELAKQKAEHDAQDLDEEVDNAWYDEKSARMELVLGEEHDTVMHAIIPYAIGGGLDLYYYPNGIDGVGIATKELSESACEGSTNDVFETYELLMFTRHELDLGAAKDDSTIFGKAHTNINSILNVIAPYSSQAVLNPKETSEFPKDMEGVGGKCFIFDSYNYEMTTAEFGMLVVIEIFRSEMEYAREHGGEQLIQKLKGLGHYPYSDLDRKAVV